MGRTKLMWIAAAVVLLVAPPAAFAQGRDEQEVNWDEKAWGLRYLIQVRVSPWHEIGSGVEGDPSVT